MLVLAPAHVADEPVVVQDDTLPAVLQCGIGQARIAEIGLVDLRRLRVGHDRVSGLAVHRAVVAFAAQGGHGLGLDESAKAVVLAGFVTEA